MHKENIKSFKSLGTTADKSIFQLNFRRGSIDPRRKFNPLFRICRREKVC